MLSELYALIDWNKVSTKTAFKLNVETYQMKSYDANAKWAAFVQTFIEGNVVAISLIYMAATDRYILYGLYNNITNISATIPQVNARFTIVY